MVFPLVGVLVWLAGDLVVVLPGLLSGVAASDLFLRWIGVFLFLRWQKEEDGRHKKDRVSPLYLQECWPPFSGLLFSSLLPDVCLCTLSVCLCSLLYKVSYSSGVENLDYTRLLDD